MRRSTTGFTIVELLIVIVVISILAVISVVAYTGIQNRANDAIVEADIANIIKKMEMAKVELGHYPYYVGDFPTGFKFSKESYDQTQSNMYFMLDVQNDRYAIGLRSKSLKGYIINSGSVTSVETVNSNTTAASLGMTWGNSWPTSTANVGYATSTGWNSSWVWN